MMRFAVEGHWLGRHFRVNAPQNLYQPSSRSRDRKGRFGRVVVRMVALSTGDIV
jgi:hypothetical protein